MGEAKKADSEAKPVLLDDLFAGVMTALVSAKNSMDAVSAEVASRYEKNPALAAAGLPYFSVSEVWLSLRFAIHEARPGQALRVLADAQSLQAVPPGLVCQADLRMGPSGVSTFVPVVAPAVKQQTEPRGKGPHAGT